MEPRRTSMVSSDSDESPRKHQFKKQNSMGSSLFFAADKKNTQSTYLPQARSGNLSLFDANKNALKRDTGGGNAYQSTFNIGNLKVINTNLPENFDVRLVRK